jgi:C-terminal processing protease CtpA/Prc
VENYILYREKIFKIINVVKDSPAEKSGLIKNIDYIVGIKNY